MRYTRDKSRGDQRRGWSRAGSRLRASLGLGLLALGIFPGCIHTGAPSVSQGGPGKPVGVTSVTVPLESLSLIADKAKETVIAPVPEPGGFSGTRFRYDLKRQQLAKARARAQAQGKLEPTPAPGEPIPKSATEPGHK